MKVVHAGKVQSLLERVRAAKSLRPFEVRQAVLAEAGIEDRVSASAFAEPPILVADQSPFRYHIEVRRTGTTKVVRSSVDRGQ